MPKHERSEYMKGVLFAEEQKEIGLVEKTLGSDLCKGDVVSRKGELHTLIEVIGEGESHSGCEYTDWKTDKGFLHIMDNQKEMKCNE